MFGSSSPSRHTRAKGRGASMSLEAVVAELANLRGQNYVDQLEVVRLGALVGGLSQQIDRLNDDLQVARNEALMLRLMPTTVDPRIEEMAREILQLREVIASQQASVVEMTGRVGDLLIQVAANAPREIPTPAQAPSRSEAPVTVMAAARPAGPVMVDYGSDLSAADREFSRGTSAAEPALSSVDSYAFSAASAPNDDVAEEPTGEFDDATLRRLRLIRQAFES